MQLRTHTTPEDYIMLKPRAAGSNFTLRPQPGAAYLPVQELMHLVRSDALTASMTESMVWIAAHIRLVVVAHNFIMLRPVLLIKLKIQAQNLIARTLGGRLRMQ